MSMKPIFWWVAFLPFTDFTLTHFFSHSILPLVDFTPTQFYPHSILPFTDFTLTHFYPHSILPSLDFTRTHFYPHPIFFWSNFTITRFRPNPAPPWPDFTLTQFHLYLISPESIFTLTLFSENFTIPSNRTACTCGPSDKRLSKASIYCCYKSSHFKSCKYHNFLLKNNSTSSNLTFKMELYIRSFKIITQFNDGKQLKNLDEAEEFSKMLEDLLNVHGTVIDALSTGFRKWTSIPEWPITWQSVSHVSDRVKNSKLENLIITLWIIAVGMRRLQMTWSRNF